MLSKATYATLDGKRVAHVESWTLDVVRFRRVPDGELLRCSMSAFKARYALGIQPTNEGETKCQT